MKKDFKLIGNVVKRFSEPTLENYFKFAESLLPTFNKVFGDSWAL